MTNNQTNQTTNKKGGTKVTTQYKLTYQQYKATKVYAYKAMLKYNQKQYNSENKNKQFTDYKTALTKLMQLPKEDILKRIQPILQEYKLNQAYGKEQQHHSELSTEEQNIINKYKNAKAEYISIRYNK